MSRNKLQKKCPKHDEPLTCLEIEGIYYVYCKKCLQKKKPRLLNCEYQHCGLKKESAIRQFMESVEYGNKKE